MINKIVACQLSSVSYESGRIVDGVPKFFHENCAAIVAAGIVLSYIVLYIYKNVPEVRK